MNERIRELAEQAKKYALDAMIKITDKEQALKVYSESYDTKFAELIIQECAALAKSKSEHIEGIKTEDHDDQVLLHSLAWRFKEFEYEIKKHFGVEE